MKLVLVLLAIYVGLIVLSFAVPAPALASAAAIVGAAAFLACLGLE